MARGGKREGAGRPRGSRSAATKEQIANISDLAKMHAKVAIDALIEVASVGQSEAARVSAANAILDRAYGKPVQTVTTPDEDAPALTINIGVREAIGDVRITKPERPAGDIPDGA